jgi:hypothetical protein
MSRPGLILIASRAFLAAILLGVGRPGLAAPGEATPAAATDAITNAAANPYSVIVARNAFRLNPPPPPLPANQAPPPVLPSVYLSGFMQTGERTNVLLVVMTPNPDPHGQDVTSYLTLAEGEGKVDILNTGTAATLTMTGNGFKGTATIPVNRNKMMAAHMTPPPPPPAVDDSTVQLAPDSVDHPAGSSAAAQ